MTERGIIEQVVKIILAHARPERIYLFGSRASGEAGARSDIDIAYQDAQTPDHAAIVREVQALGTLLKIDVSNLARCEPRFVERVRTSGRVLYSASKRLRAEDGLHNFYKALARYREALALQAELTDKGLASVYLDLIAKRFEFTYEMSWKALRRYLDHLGVGASHPRACFKEAFALGLIDDEALWLDMIEHRNLSSHVYDEAEIRGLLDRAQAFGDAFAELELRLRGELENEIKMAQREHP